MKVSVPCPDPFSILTCHLHNLHLLLVQCPCAPTMATAPWVTLDDPPALGAPTHTNHSCSIPSDACLPLVQHLCVHAYGHMGSFNKKGEFPTVPHHLRSPTMAVASQETLDGPPALAIQHPHVHQKGEMNMTTTTTQPQRHNDNCDNRDMPTTTMQQQPQHNNNNHNNTTTTATTTM